MEKFFVNIIWKDETTPIFHLIDSLSLSDEYISVPDEIDMQMLDKKICCGTTNPYTREYHSCNNIINLNETQCNKCKYLFDFYKCVRCHGDNCYVYNDDVKNYCNTPHYVYLAYFNGDKVKVGTASEIKKYERLLEQGALNSILIAKTPTGKVARIIEKIIIDYGITGLVTTNYKMKNIVSVEDTKDCYLTLLRKYNEILKILPYEYQEYIIEPELNNFNKLDNLIKQKMINNDVQLSLFNSSTGNIEEYCIKKDNKTIKGKYLFIVGKILAVENNGLIELYDIKKNEGMLFDFKNMNLSIAEINTVRRK